jgi:hypothetical protein
VVLDEWSTRGYYRELELPPACGCDTRDRHVWQRDTRRRTAGGRNGSRGAPSARISRQGSGGTCGRRRSSGVAAGTTVAVVPSGPGTGPRSSSASTSIVPFGSDRYPQKMAMVAGVSSYSCIRARSTKTTAPE